MIKTVGATPIKDKHRASGHCGTNTNTARHYFCVNCGIYTHHQRRSNPNEYGYNVGCLEGVNPFDLEPVTLNDGVNHPADRKA